MEDNEDQIAGFLEEYRPEIRAFAQALRVVLKETTEPAYELAGVSAQSFNIGYSFTTRAWDAYVAIIVYRNHINLSFPSGASLSDPEGLLHGTGIRVRHLKIKSLDDLRIPGVPELLREARQNAFDRFDGPENVHEGVRTVLKRDGKKSGNR